MQNAWLPLNHLNKPKISVGGMCYLYFTPSTNVVKWPPINPQTGTITEDITLADGKTWYKCGAIEKNRIYSEKYEKSDAGLSVESIVNCFLPSDEIGNAYSINQMKHYEFAIVVRERNGIMRLIGDQYSGASFMQSYTTADAYGNPGRNLEFSWKSVDSAPVFLRAESASDEVIDAPWVISSESVYDVHTKLFGTFNDWVSQNDIQVTEIA